MNDPDFHAFGGFFAWSTSGRFKSQPQPGADAPRYLYLPACYDEQPDARFPVMYMFDGHNVFFDEDATYGQSWGMADYMDKTDTPLIIAAVECNPVGNNRLEEYCPFTCEDPSLGRIRGRGRATMEWFIRDFKPMIDANLRTLPDRANTLIAGSSMGG